MTQLLQEALLPDTRDQDILNFLFSVLPQIISRLGVDTDTWKLQVALLKNLASKRDNI